MASQALTKESFTLKAKRELARQMSRESLFYLGRHILNYEGFGRTQCIWDEWTRKNIDLTAKRPGKFLILQPRETYKTTFFTITLTYIVG